LFDLTCYCAAVVLLRWKRYR